MPEYIMTVKGKDYPIKAQTKNEAERKMQTAIKQKRVVWKKIGNK